VFIHGFATGNLVAGNYLGTDVTGTKALGNELVGVEITDSASNNTIGGTAAGDRNVISGSLKGGGVFIHGFATGNLVAGNYLGTDVTGTKALGNALVGVEITDSASNNTIGGTAAGDRNVISGNAGGGVFIAGSATGNLVAGNYISGNAGGGMHIAGSATGNLVAGNYGSGNAEGGVFIAVQTVPAGLGDPNVFSVQGNVGATSNSGTPAGAGNGIWDGYVVIHFIIDAATTGVVDQYNFIGTEFTGTAALGNALFGVQMLTLQLGGETGGMPTVPGLQPLSGAALPLIATLLTLTIQTSTAEFDPGAFEGEAAAAVSFLPVSTVTVGQSLSEHAGTGGSENSDQEGSNKPQEPNLPVTQESSSWQPFLMGLDEALDQFCRDSLDQFMSRDEPAPDKAQPPHALSKPLNLWQRDQASPEARGTDRTDSIHLPEVNQGQIIDEAIRSLWADESRLVRTYLTPTSVLLASDGTTPAETAPADAALLSTEPVQRQDGPLLSSYERGFEALNEFAVSLLLTAFVARRIDPPGTRHCTPTNPFSSLRLLRWPLFRFR
jgi:parallel beta-helix repeat protein